jgi:hypothetical protein
MGSVTSVLPFTDTFFSGSASVQEAKKELATRRINKDRITALIVKER